MILFLGPANSPVVDFLLLEEEVIVSQDKISVEDLKGVDFVVSFGYRHLIKPDVIEFMKGRAINLHISLLPFNRGADPNFWSFFDDTPKGVSIHLLNSRLDEGDILAQNLVSLSDLDTFRITYGQLQEGMLRLFKEFWPWIKAGGIEPSAQFGSSSYHRSSDKEKYISGIDNWLDIPIRELLARFKSQ